VATLTSKEHWFGSLCIPTDVAKFAYFKMCITWKLAKGKKMYNEIELNSSNSLTPQEIGRHF
jgi:hypothetical protein